MTSVGSCPMGHTKKQQTRHLGGLFPLIPPFPGGRRRQNEGQGCDPLDIRFPMLSADPLRGVGSLEFFNVPCVLAVGKGARHAILYFVPADIHALNAACAAASLATGTRGAEHET